MQAWTHARATAGGAATERVDNRQQDWSLCERTQLGVQSHAFRPGPLSFEETSVADFHRAYQSWLASAGH
ncbi:SRPBCC family protein [Marmoricola sp. RAF53]|uniref:SRPBCC family protein n=1 Tax=Marmoricola sp. RAF53 TaxID=3233059 RepID=UPI003F9ABC54